MEGATETAMAMAVIVGAMETSMEGATVMQWQLDGNDGKGNGRCNGDSNGATATQRLQFVQTTQKRMGNTMGARNQSNTNM